MPDILWMRTSSGDFLKIVLVSKAAETANFYTKEKGILGQLFKLWHIYPFAGQRQTLTRK